MDFKEWITQFVIKHKIDMNEPVKAKNCTLQVGNVINAFVSTPHGHEEFKKILTYLADKGEDPLRFVKHAAKDLDYTYKLGGWDGKREIFSC